MKNPQRGDLVVCDHKGGIKIFGVVENTMDISSPPTCSVKIILPERLEGQAAISLASKLTFIDRVSAISSGDAETIRDRIPQILISMRKNSLDLEKQVKYLVKADKVRMP